MFPSTKPEVGYKPISDVEDGTERRTQPKQQSDDSSWLGKGLKSSTTIHAAIISIEVVLCIVLLAGSICLDRTRQALSIGAPLDGLSQLGLYNTTMRFQNNSNLVGYTHEAAEYWRDLLDNGGVVSLNTEWAQEQGLRPSAESPTDSTQSIYQVDVYHALHCMVSQAH